MTADVCQGCACQAEHYGDYGASGRPGPCPPHTCFRPPVTADHTPERRCTHPRPEFRWDDSQWGWTCPLCSTRLVLLEADDLAALRAECDVLREQTAHVEAAFAGIRCALLHWQPEGVTKAVSCANCQSWAANIAMPFYRAALHPDHERTSG